MGLVRFRVATEFNVVNVNVAEEVQQRVERLIAENRCLGCEEVIAEGTKVRLHQCETCYGATYRALLAGKKTREELMSLGKIAEMPKGPKPKNDYTASLRGKK